MYSNFVYLACLLWLAVSFFLFQLIPLRKAILLSLFSGWMFLPIFSITIAGLPDITKFSLVVVSISLFCLVLELRGSVERPKFRFQIFDMIVNFYILIYPFTAYINELGLYEGFSASLARVIEVGAPYYIGRLYFSNISSHSLITKLYVAATFLYLPFAAFELRFSPQLHNMVYGYTQHSFYQTIRFGVWRPMIFMRHGLEVSLWFSLATLFGFWLIRSKMITKGFTILGIGILAILTIIGQSYGSILLLIIGLVTLYTSHFFKIGVSFLLLFIFPSIYITNRIIDIKLEKPIIEMARSYLPLARFRSVTFRVNQEYLLTARANEKMFFGWGRDGGYRILDDQKIQKGITGNKWVNEYGNDRVVTDSRWIIEYGIGGLFSLVPFILIFTFPIIGLYRIAPASLWHTTNFAPSAALAVGTAAVLNDLILNDFCSPIHFLIIGAISYSFIDQNIYTLYETNVTEEAKQN